MTFKENNVVTFGCRLNIYESEIIKQNLQKSGLENAVVFNTCTVTKAAEKEAITAIKKYRKDNPDTKIIVTGCAVQASPEKFAALKEIDKIIGNEEKLYSENYNLNTERLLVNDIMSIKETANHIISEFTEHSRAFLQVQNGCDHRCTFCIIPYGRGNSRSTPIGTIVKQVQKLVDSGYNEVVLTGVDVTSYGPDLPGSPKFGDMIKRLLTLVPNLKRLRLSSIDVAEIDDVLFDLMCYEPRLMPHFHISLQAGDNMILKRMKRRHTREEVLDFCYKLREIRKDVSFGADIIAGFPTESDEMFENTRRLISEADLQYLHVFPYSERDGTPASRMPQVDKKIRKDRAKILREEGEKNLHKFFKKFDNTDAKILVENENFGHTENFIPVQFAKPEIKGSVVHANIKYTGCLKMSANQL
jgi:threonylcarbamoyladenosine tRNA methylthiotransferase MtaB